MRSIDISSTLGRPLGAALLFAALASAGLAAVAASWADLSAAVEERDAKAELLQRGVAASRRAQVAPQTPATDPFVRADTATLAAAAVDADVRAQAETAGLSLLSSRAEAKPEDRNAAGDAGGSGASEIGTRIEDQAVLEGQNEALQAMLVALEDGAPAVLVDDIAVEPAAADGTAAVDPQAPRLHVSLTVSAYWRPRAAAAK